MSAETNKRLVTAGHVFLRAAAGLLYEARGKQPSHEQEDWVQAEREVKNHFGLK